MALLTPARLRHGFTLFVIISLVASAGVVLYGSGGQSLFSSFARIEWRWLLVGVALASMDWFGGGLRLWILARQIHPDPPLRGMVIAGGMGAWGAYVSPAQTGASPMIVYTMKRYGVPLPKAVTTTLMSFIATVIFFAVCGPLALILGAGKSLGSVGNVLGLSLLDLFKGSMGIFAALGLLLVGVLLAPRMISSAVHRLATALGKRSTRVAARLEGLRAGIDQAHDSMVAFNTPRGWVALLWATLASGPSHANKLLAGYVALRTIGIEAPFVDVLLLQTLLSSLLYFAPTPGAAGAAELLSTAVMSTFVPRELTPVYTILWRGINTWFTIAAGFVVFTMWVRQGLKEIEEPSESGSKK